MVCSDGLRSAEESEKSGKTSVVCWGVGVLGC